MAVFGLLLRLGISIEKPSIELGKGLAHTLKYKNLEGFRKLSN